MVPKLVNYLRSASTRGNRISEQWPRLTTNPCEIVPESGRAGRKYRLHGAAGLTVSAGRKETFHGPLTRSIAEKFRAARKIGFDRSSRGPPSDSRSLILRRGTDGCRMAGFQESPRRIGTFRQIVNKIHDSGPSYALRNRFIMP